jgi:hypothetical protein
MPTLSTEARIGMSAALLALGGVIDSGAFRRPSFGPSRQTPLLWACSLGRDGAAFAWGFDLGAALTTRLPFFGLIGVLAYVVLSGSVAQSLAIVGAYGLGRALSTAVVITRSSDHSASCTRLGNLARRISVSASGAAIGVAILGLGLAVR